MNASPSRWRAWDGPPALTFRVRVPSLHSTDKGGGKSKPLGHAISPSHDPSPRAGPSPGAVPGNTTLASCKKGQVPGWGVGSVQGTEEIAPQGAGVTGDCGGAETQ